MTGSRGTKTGTKYYSDFERAAGIILLGVNKQDYKKTAEMLDVSEQTIRNWEKESLTKNLAIPMMLEMTIKKLLEMMPTTWSGNSWAVAFGILMDKWLLVNGQPTQRTETYLGDLDNLSDREKENVLAEAERIINDAVSRGTDNKEIK